MIATGRVRKFRLSTEFPDTMVRDGGFGNTDFAHGTLGNILCLAISPKYLAVANENPSVSCVVTVPDLISSARPELGVVATVEPAFAFYTVHNRLYKAGGLTPALELGIHPSARIHPTAVVEDGCHIGAGVVVDSNAVVKAGTHLSEGVYIGAGALIGVEGHFYKHFAGRLMRIEHAGGVRIGRRAEVLAGAIVQRSLHPDFTEIGEETVLAPGVHVGHGVKIGNHSLLAGSCQVAGYSRIGNNVWIGPSSAISNLVTIGDGARVEIGATVVKSIPAGERYSGFVAGPHIRTIRAQARVLGQ